MRISSYDQYNRVQVNVNQIQRDIASQQFQLATGKQFDKASENPIKAKQIEVVKQAVSKIEQYEKNVNDSKGILETTETVMKGAYNSLESVNNELIKASNETYNIEDMKSIATVIDKIIDQMVSVGNTKHLNRFVFGGEKILTKPFDYDGTTSTYNGNDNDVTVQISAYSEVKVHESGNKILKKTIDDLIKIRDMVKNEDRAGIQTMMGENQKNMDAIINNIADIGVRRDSLNNISEGFIEQKMNLENRRSTVEDVDFTKLMVDFSISQATYKGTLQATSMMFKTSILDFM